MWGDLLEEEQIRSTAEIMSVAKEATDDLRGYVVGAISRDDFENRVFLVRASIDNAVGPELADVLIAEWAKELQ